MLQCKRWRYGWLTHISPQARHFAFSLPADSSGLKAAAQMITDGKLVAFPTETVWGLGANAFNPEAVALVFKVKGRPRTNPLIVHIPGKDHALPLAILQGESLKYFNILADRFWPGPLTLVVKSSSVVPEVVTAGTGFVAVRCPQLPIALSLLRCCDVPIVAPSANMSGKISPTQSWHVLEAFPDADIGVLEADSVDGVLCCQHGVESTVVQIDELRQEINILREGAVSQTSIIKAISVSNLAENPLWSVVSNTMSSKEGKQPLSPGQSVSHYAPDRTIYIVSSLNASKISDVCDIFVDTLHNDVLRKTVIIDYGKRLEILKEYALDYRDISMNENPVDAAKVLFESLRWADKVPGGTLILLADVSRSVCGEYRIYEENRFIDSIAPALSDRMLKAASGIRKHFVWEKEDQH